jgi:hypothetical protein
MLENLNSFVFLNKINEEILVETKINDAQYLVEYKNNYGDIKVIADTYSAFWYPDIYELVGTL